MNQDPIINFKFDKINDNRLVDYFFNKFMGIELWNADSNFNIGIIKVPLKNLLRQGKFYYFL